MLFISAFIQFGQQTQLLKVSILIFCPFCHVRLQLLPDVEQLNLNKGLTAVFCWENLAAMLGFSGLACFNHPAKAKIMSVIFAPVMHIRLILAKDNYPNHRILMMQQTR